jgi:transposase
MFVDVCNNNGKPYLRLVESMRVENAAGKKVPQKKTVLNIGPVDRFDDGAPDFIGRLRKSFKIGQPLITALEPYCEKKAPLEEYTVKFKEGDTACFGQAKLFSHMLLERIVEELGLRNLFASYKGFTKIEYDVYGFAKLMIFGRLLNPASKIATTRQNGDYYAPILDKGFNPDNIYDTLDFVADNHDRIIRRMNTNLMKKVSRRPEVVYYDVTNFYYHTEEPDDDIINEEDGEVIEQGLRKFGVCKEKLKQPIVQMGLFMDDEGLPIAVEAFPGNTLDHQTLQKALRRSVDGLELSRFILVGDRGVCIGPVILDMLDNGNGYIFAKSVLKSSAAERVWIYSEEGYISDSPSFKYKSRIRKRTVKGEGEDAEEREVTEKVVAYWSEKYARRAAKENKSFLEFLDRLMESPASFRITAFYAKRLRAFLSSNVVNKKTGEISSSSEWRALLDMGKVEAYKKSFGYYQIVTSELTMDTKEVIRKYRGLSQIENQFRLMKGSLETRPLFVRTPNHVSAHLLICMIALTVLRIIQNRIAKSGLVPPTDEKEVSWSMGLSGERVQNALNKWQVDKLPSEHYRFLNIENPDVKLILDAFDIKIPPKLFTRIELKQIKTGIEIFM